MRGDDFVPYARQDITQSDQRAVIAALTSAFVAQGPAIEEFETSLASYLGVKDVVAVASGTAGLHLACLAAGITRGDAVIVPAQTFAASANAILYCGATPIFADIEDDTLGLAPASVERSIFLARSAGLSPRALIPVHYAGLPCKLNELSALAKTHHLTVIADACHAFGAEYRTKSDHDFRKVGSRDGTDMSVFSFHAVKHITTGEGGAISTANEGIGKRLRLLRSHGISKNPDDWTNHELARDPSTGHPNPWYQEMQLLGFNYRLSDIAATLGRSQLRRIDDIVARRRTIAGRYRNALASLPKVRLPPDDYELARHSYHLFPLLIDFRAIGKPRRQVMNELHDLGIGSQVHYLPVFLHAYYQANKRLWLADDAPRTHEIYEKELSIPMYAGLTDNDVDRVIESLHRVLGSS